MFWMLQNDGSVAYGMKTPNDVVIDRETAMTLLNGGRVGLGVAFVKYAIQMGAKA